MYTCIYIYIYIYLFIYLLLLAFDYFHICVKIHGNKNEWWWTVKYS